MMMFLGLFLMFGVPPILWIIAIGALLGFKIVLLFTVLVPVVILSLISKLIGKMIILAS